MSDTVPQWASAELSAQLPTLRAAGETPKVDLKEDFSEQAHRLAKDIAAMASSGGGRWNCSSHSEHIRFSFR